MPKIIAPYVYCPMLAYLMHCWKYNGEQRLSRTAAKLITKSPICTEYHDITLPTPLHWRRFARRGFNQSQDLLNALHRLNPESFPKAPARSRLRRTGMRPPQAHASKSERARLVAGTFRASGDLQGRSVLLIDDVCTTGATARAMTVALQQAGAARVTLLCLARTPAHGGSS